VDVAEPAIDRSVGQMAIAHDFDLTGQRFRGGVRQAEVDPGKRTDTSPTGEIEELSKLLLKAPYARLPPVLARKGHLL
jgi:hypothetical protein